MLGGFKNFRLPKYLVSKHFVQEISLVVMLVALGTIVFTQEYKDNQRELARQQARAASNAAMAEELSEQLGDLKLENERLAEAYEKVSTSSALLANEAWNSSVKLYKDLKSKFEDYKEEGLDLSEYDDDLNEVLVDLLAGNYDELTISVNTLDDEFEKLMAEKVEEDKKKAAASNAAAQAPVTSNPGGGYSRITVNTEKGSFVVSLIKVDLGGVQVVTVTGNDGNCDNNCNVKPLGSYVAENQGFAGINGTYFCPPDYGSCAGKVNSYDFPVYSSVHNKWINDDKLFWNGRGMMAFSGGSSWFCADAKSCNVGVTAGIVNYPSLINNGNIIVETGSLPDSLKSVRGYRGAMGLSGSTLYLMVVRGATVPDVAYVMKALGIQNGLNLDGGGSTAMFYNGRYMAGPGRNLPNAVVLRYR